MLLAIAAACNWMAARLSTGMPDLIVRALAIANETHTDLGRSRDRDGLKPAPGDRRAVRHLGLGRELQEALRPAVARHLRLAAERTARAGL